MTHAKVYEQCIPHWFSLTQRASFYIECAQNFDINGFLSRGEMNVRNLEVVGKKLRTNEKKSATQRITAGAAQVAGGIMFGLGLGKQCTARQKKIHPLIT